MPSIYYLEKKMKIPKVGDYLIFNKDYHLVDMYSMISEGTITRVVGSRIQETDSGWRESVDYIVYIAFSLLSIS